VNDTDLAGLLAGVAAGDLDAVPILCDLLEERGDPRAERLRRLYVTLQEDRLYAPLAFRQFQVVRRTVLPLFPEYAVPAE
jgi:hypothetical protein